MIENYQNYLSELTLLLETVIVIGFIIRQLIVTRNIKKNVKILSKIFEEKLYVQEYEASDFMTSEDNEDIEELLLEDKKTNFLLGETKDVKVFILKTVSNNPITSRIKTSINRYLLNNLRASTSFTSIKYIVDNEVSIVDDEITNELSTPLYLGLAATELGIVFGLVSVLLSLVGIDDELMIINVKAGVTANLLPLIVGVAIAMVASFHGLYKTMRLSTKYNKINKLTSRAKNDLISYLQAHLMPELVKAEDTGLQGLINSINQFKIQAQKISADILTSAMQSKENIIYQQDLLEKIDKLDINKISKANLEIFNKLEENLDSIQSISELLGSLGQISTNLKKFADRTNDVELIIKQINDSQSDMSELLQFITKHFNEIEELSRKTVGAVSLADDSFENALIELKNKIEMSINILNNQVSKADDIFNKAIDELVKNILKRIESLDLIAKEADMDLHKTFKQLTSKLNETASDHIKEFQKCYSEAVPKFDKLDQLDILLEINKTLNDNQLQIGLDNITKKTDEYGNNLLSSIKEVKSNLNDERLSRIAETLNVINSKLVKKKEHRQTNNIKAPYINKPDKTTLNEKLTKLIGRS